MNFTMDSIGRLTGDDSTRFENSPDKSTEEFIDEYEIIENGNCYVDQLLESLIGNMKTGFDPYCLEDYILKMPFVKAGLCNGRVTGLQTLHRADDCFLTKTYRRLHIAANIGASDVNIVYEVTIELKCFTLKFTLNLHVGYIQIVTHFSVSSNSGRDTNMYQFEVEDMHDMVPSIAIYKPLDWLLNKVVRTSVWFLNNPIKRVFSNLIKRRIQDGLSSCQFPVVINRTSPRFDESSEKRHSRDKRLYPEEGCVESLTDRGVQSVVVFKENSSESVFQTTLGEFGCFQSSCEEIDTKEFTPALAFQLALEEFRRRKPSYEIL